MVLRRGGKWSGVAGRVTVREAICCYTVKICFYTNVLKCFQTCFQAGHVTLNTECNCGCKILKVTLDFK